MKRILALTLLLSGCASFPPPEPCKICDASSAPRHDAPVRLFNDNIDTPCGRPHPGWTPALRERMARERQLNASQTPMDREADYVTRPMRVPVGLDRELLLWKPNK